MFDAQPPWSDLERRLYEEDHRARRDAEQIARLADSIARKREQTQAVQPRLCDPRRPLDPELKPDAWLPIARRGRFKRRGAPAKLCWGRRGRIGGSDE